jgi:hypothetical protein
MRPLEQNVYYAGISLAGFVPSLTLRKVGKGGYGLREVIYGQSDIYFIWKHNKDKSIASQQTLKHVVE